MNEAVLSIEVARLIDQGIETLRWCRQHAGERGVAEKLQQHLISVGAITLALGYEADGKLEKALQALEHGDWRPPSLYQLEDRPE